MAKNAVDGFCCRCSAVTKKEDSPWWEVDLQKMYNIETINITTSNQNALEGKQVNYYRLTTFIKIKR